MIGFSGEESCHFGVPCPREDVTPTKQLIDTGISPQRRATRTYRAKRRNGHYTTPTSQVPTPSRPTRSNVIPLHRVKRKLHFGRMPPKSRVAIAADSSTPVTKSEKASQKRTESPRKNEQQLSRELQKLMDVTCCMLPVRLRSSYKVWDHCHGDEPSHHDEYQLQSSPDHTNLKLGRGS